MHICRPVSFSRSGMSFCRYLHLAFLFPYVIMIYLFDTMHCQVSDCFRSKQIPGPRIWRFLQGTPMDALMCLNENHTNMYTSLAQPINLISIYIHMYYRTNKEQHFYMFTLWEKWPNSRLCNMSNKALLSHHKSMSVYSILQFFLIFLLLQLDL